MAKEAEAQFTSWGPKFDQNTSLSPSASASSADNNLPADSNSPADNISRADKIDKLYEVLMSNFQFRLPLARNLLNRNFDIAPVNANDNIDSQHEIDGTAPMLSNHYISTKLNIYEILF